MSCQLMNHSFFSVGFLYVLGTIASIEDDISSVHMESNPQRCMSVYPISHNLFTAWCPELNLHLLLYSWTTFILKPFDMFNRETLEVHQTGFLVLILFSCIYTTGCGSIMDTTSCLTFHSKLHTTVKSVVSWKNLLLGPLPITCAVFFCCIMSYLMLT